MNIRTSVKALFGTITLTTACIAQASDTVTLRVHHFLAPASVAHSKFIEPWCAKINEDSNGKLKCQIYPSMQLGGNPTQLFDQVKDGVADIIWTMPGYQPGRFMITEAFELPFMTTTGEKSSRALWEFLDKYAAHEYKDVKPLIFHVNEGAQLHTANKPIKTLADFRGVKLRAPTRQAARLIAALGATPVTTPMPQVPESLARSVIDGAMLPWEVIPPLKIQEVVKYHSETPLGTPNLANYVYLLAMNPAKYASLPGDLKRVIDANSGADASAWAGRIWDDARVPSREMAVAQKNSFYEIPQPELEKWKQAAAGVTKDWIKAVNSKGHDGNALLEEARRLMQ